MKRSFNSVEYQDWNDKIYWCLLELGYHAGSFDPVHPSIEIKNHYAQLWKKYLKYDHEILSIYKNHFDLLYFYYAWVIVQNIFTNCNSWLTKDHRIWCPEVVFSFSHIVAALFEAQLNKCFKFVLKKSIVYIFNSI